VAVKVKRYGSFIRKLVKEVPIVLGFMWQNGWNAANCYFESSKDIKEIRKEPFQ
jgi:hypothetical protein